MLCQVLFFFREVVRTNADGRDTLHLGPGLSYIIAVTDDQWAAPSKTGIVVEEGEPRDGLDFRLGKGTLIRGKVTFDAKNMMMWATKGQPIELTQEGNAIAAPPGQTTAEQLSRLVPTDREGGFAARVGPGRFKIVASARWAKACRNHCQGRGEDRQRPPPPCWPGNDCPQGSRVGQFDGRQASRRRDPARQGG